jgi:CHASE3 domain sensor protein
MGDFNSMDEYLKNYETIKNEIKEYTHELRSII